MGCDIHNTIEVNVNGKWSVVSEELGPKHWLSRVQKNDPDWDKASWSIERNYMLFGFLAGVRNDCFNPVGNNGLPNDISDETKDKSDSWLGDAHSHGYITLTELIKARDSETALVFGYVDLGGYMEYKENGYPKNWFQNCPYSWDEISLEEMDRLDNLYAFADADAKIVCKISFQYPVKEIDKSFFGRYIDKMIALNNDPNNVRMIYWFDN